MSTDPDSLIPAPGFRTLRVAVPATLLFNVVVPEPTDPADEARIYEAAKKKAAETLARRRDVYDGFAVPGLNAGGRCYTSRHSYEPTDAEAVEIEDEWESTKQCLAEDRLDAELGATDDERAAS